MFIDFLFPKHCVLCWKIEDYLCSSCKKKLSPHPEICPICHRFSKDYKVCWDCKSWGSLEGIIIPFSYIDSVKKLILKIKYYHKRAIWKFISERLNLALLCNESFQADSKKNNVLVSFIPSHRWRHYITKWYNQSEVLAKNLSKLTGYHFLKIARKVKKTKSQAQLSSNQRKVNLKDSFVVLPNIINWCETILLVDDVTTTGSTILELAKTIKKTYPKTKIRWIVVARHNKN